MQENETIEITCTACGRGEVLGVAEMAQWLVKRSLLHRGSEAEPAFLRELLRVHAANQTCPACQQVGLVVTAAAEDAFAWPQARSCEVCRQLMDAERLEVFPNATRCAKCQQLGEQGQLAEDPEYCPRCGSLLQLAQSRRSGIARYELRCTGGCR